MKELQSKHYEFHVSEEIFGQMYGDRPEITQENIIYHVGGDIDISELALSALVPEEARHRFKVLHAHAILPSDNWSYEDGGQEYPVQQWVETMDGTASVLIIACCNTNNKRLTTKRSSLIYPTTSFSLYEAMYGEVEFITSPPNLPDSR